MSSPEQPRLPTADCPAAPEDLDALLRAFFRAEMPDPWPAFAPPAPTLTLNGPARRARRPFRFGPRLALAASVLLLLATATLVSRVMPDHSSAATGSVTGGPRPEMATRVHAGGVTPDRPAAAPPRERADGRSGDRK